MKKLKISLKNLFSLLETSESEIDKLTLIESHNVLVKTPTGEFVPVIGTIRKMDEKIKINLSNTSIICGKHHILIDEHGNEVFAKDAINISTILGVQSIISKEDVGYGLVYDISIPAPHLYVTPNGMIHHNTTFIRGLLSHTKQSAILAYNPKIIENDSFFVQWLESTDMFMILEDADNLITPRKDGNDVMSKFLNIGDGLMSFKNKKIVFSTNLPSVASIDPALTRAGRCFDIVQFDYLSREQAQRLADVVQLPLADGNQFTVSDVFSASRNEVKFAKDAKLNRGFGFV